MENSLARLSSLASLCLCGLFPWIWPFFGTNVIPDCSSIVGSRRASCLCRPNVWFYQSYFIVLGEGTVGLFKVWCLRFETFDGGLAVCPALEEVIRVSVILYNLHKHGHFPTNGFDFAGIDIGQGSSGVCSIGRSRGRALSRFPAINLAHPIHSGSLQTYMKRTLNAIACHFATEVCKKRNAVIFTYFSVFLFQCLGYGLSSTAEKCYQRCTLSLDGQSPNLWFYRTRILAQSPPLIRVQIAP